MSVKSFYFPGQPGSNDLVVHSDVIDNADGLRWRLRTEEKESEWSSSYSEILILETSEGAIGMTSPYYEGLLPVFTPFLIQPGLPVVD